MGNFILSIMALLFIAANGVLYSALYGPYVDTWSGIMQNIGGWGLVTTIVFVGIVAPLLVAIRWIGRRNKKNLATKKLRLLNWVFVVWNALWLGLFFFISPLPVQEVWQQDGMWIVNLVRGTPQAEEGWIRIERKEDTPSPQTGSQPPQTAETDSEPLTFPAFQNDQDAVEYALICAVRGRYALMFGTPEHLKPLAQCLTRKGAAAMGMTLVGMEVAGGAFVEIASGIAEQTGGAEKVEQLKKEMEKRQERLKQVLTRYNIPLSTPKWNDELLETLQPRGRRFLLEMIPFWEETLARKEAREAAKGEDPKQTRERHSQDVIAMANHVVGFATYKPENSTRFTISFPADEKEGMPDEAVMEDGHWRINWPRSKKQ